MCECGRESEREEDSERNRDRGRNLELVYGIRKMCVSVARHIEGGLHVCD